MLSCLPDPYLIGMTHDPNLGIDNWVCDHKIYTRDKETIIDIWKEVVLLHSLLCTKRIASYIAKEEREKTISLVHKDKKEDNKFNLISCKTSHLHHPITTHHIIILHTSKHFHPDTIISSEFCFSFTYICSLSLSLSLSLSRINAFLFSQHFTSFFFLYIFVKC